LNFSEETVFAIGQRLKLEYVSLAAGLVLIARALFSMPK
jgi:hypothetical protein